MENDDELARFLSGDGDLSRKLDTLVAALVAREVPDNIVAIAIRGSRAPG